MITENIFKYVRYYKYDCSDCFCFLTHGRRIKIGLFLAETEGNISVTVN